MNQETSWHARWLEWAIRLLSECRPPLRNWHFWMIQGLVIFIGGMHAVFETNLLPHPLELRALPIGLFLVPVVYAALTFGLAGALITSFWATLLSFPNYFLWHTGVERWEEVFQILVVNVVAFFVGQQVNWEKGARRQAEEAATALRASRMKYRSLFESSPVAILVLDHAGRITEANPSACLLFGKGKAALEGVPLAELLGTAGRPSATGSSRDGRWQVDTLVLKPEVGPDLYVERTLAETSDGEGNPVTQVLLRDITREHERQEGLKAYAAHILQAQEEERKRMARELHDDTVQSLTLLYRRLDSAQVVNGPLPPALAELLGQCRAVAEDLIKNLRDFTKSLRPPTLDDLGLVSSVRRLVTDLAHATGANVRFKVRGEERRLPGDAEVGMFRIAQEALHNVQLHAQASRVVVTMSFAADFVRLDVFDNGTGFSMPTGLGEVIDRARHGLLSMQERAGLLGGTLEIQSGLGKGTRVTLSVPAGRAAVAQPEAGGQGSAGPTPQQPLGRPTPSQPR